MHVYLFQYAYVIDSDDLRNMYIEQPSLSNLPFYNARFIRTTKFPRIGRSLLDIEDLPSGLDIHSTMTNNDNDDMNNEHESRWFEQRSVLFPRIGKRAATKNSLVTSTNIVNPYQMIDTSNPYHVNNDDDRQHSNSLQSIVHYRGRRDISM
jgi:hypothetical protein